MKIGWYKDGGALSKVHGFFFESKKYFSIVLLRFSPGTREAFHSHAFNAYSIVFGPGFLTEYFLHGGLKKHHPGSFVYTSRDNMHKVSATGYVWVLSFRGPWCDTWQEVTEDGSRVTLTHNRIIRNKQ